MVATTRTGIGKRAVEDGLICRFAIACNRARLSWFEPGEQHQVVRHHGGPDVGLEVVQSAPGATNQREGKDRPAAKKIGERAEQQRSDEHAEKGRSDEAGKTVDVKEPRR